MSASNDRERRGGFPWGCLALILVLFVLAAGAVAAIGFAFDQGEDAGQPDSAFNAGLADAYEPASVNYLETENIYVVRAQDGEFFALYDLPPRQQELGGDCRVRFDEQASIGPLEPMPGITGAFVEDCEVGHTAWRADGEYGFGAGYGDLDRFDTHVNDAGELIIETDDRTCTRSRGVPGQPPYLERRCRG